MDGETDPSCGFMVDIKEDIVEVKEETVEVNDDITGLEDNPQIFVKEEQHDLDDSMVNTGGYFGEDVMFDMDKKENVKTDLDIKEDLKIEDIGIKDEQMEDWPMVEAEYSFEDNDETEQHIQEMIESIGIIKWKQYKQPFDKFWYEQSVRIVRKAVRDNFMTKEGGASMLGIQPRVLEHTNYVKKPLDFPKLPNLPIIVQRMVDKWGIVTKEVYIGQGSSVKEFWGETFVKNVPYAVHKDLLSTSGAAFLLEVSVENLDDQLRKAYRKRSRKALEEVAEYRRKSSNFEPLPEDWWLDLGHEDLSKVSDVEDIIRKSRINRHWFLFLNFSQFGKTTKFNPYKASMQEVAEFFHFMKLKNMLSEINRPGNILASLSIYLLDLAETNVIDLLNSNPLAFSMRYFKDVIIKGVKHLDLTVTPYDSTWSAFVKFCNELEEKSFIEVDPFLAKPKLVLDFLTRKFVAGIMRVEAVLSKPFLKPAHNFCSENLNRVLSELDWHLQHSWLEGSLKTSGLLDELVSAAHSCDERLVKNVGDLAFKLSPNYSYTKFRVSQADNYSEDKFWNNKLTRGVLKDVKSKVFPIAVAASGLGVTSEMVHSVVMLGKASDQEKIGVRDYVCLGFGSEQEFWQEESILSLLKDVRNRKNSVDEIAAQFGVSRMKIMEKCGGVKDIAEVEAEKTMAMFNKMKQKADNVVEVEKKKTELEEKIEMLEKADWNSLSGYEKMRLKNMRERQALIESLDFDKEKREIQALTPKNKPHQLKAVHVHQRERSARVKRRSEAEQLAKQQSSDHNMSRAVWEKIRDKRSSSGWFSHWVPRSFPSKNWRRKSLTEIHFFDIFDEEAIRGSNHVPKFDLSAAELLEISPNYQKSRALLDSFSGEFKEIKEEQKLQTKVDWDKFEVAHDCMVSASELTSLDSRDDFICFGTKCGGVGVFLAGKAVTLKPHNRKVTRTLFTSQEGSGPSIVSAGLDGTVRMTDLVHQSVSLEYSWDQSYGGKQGLNWLEEMEVNSFILDCGAEINQIDTRSKVAKTLIQLTNEQMEPYMDTNLSVNPANKNMISLCRGQSVQIWDLRNSSQPVKTLTPPGAQIMAGGGWSAGGSYLVTCGQSYLGVDVPVVYPGTDWSEPILKLESSRKTTFLPGTGVTWCPWDEKMFLITALQPNLMNSPYSCRSVVAVDCSSGAIVGDLKSGLDNSTYMVHCHKTRQVVVVGNSKGPGGLVVFKMAEDG